MDKAAISKAKERVLTAKTAVQRIASCVSYQEFTSEWYLFLMAAKNVYTILEQGAKTSAQSRQWYGSKKRFRKQDQLLEYLFIARDDAEHGLASGTEYVPGSQLIGVFKPGLSHSISISGSTEHGLTVKSLDGLPVGIAETKSHAKLVTVTGRSPTDKFDPPILHLGLPLTDISPLTVAKLAVSYLEALVSEAEKL